MERRVTRAVDWSWEHTPLWGAVNTGGAVFAAAALAHVTHVPPQWALVLGAAGALSAVGDGVVRELAGRSLVYRASAWLTCGIWGFTALMSTPFALNMVLSLFVAAVVGGLLQTSFAAADRKRVDHLGHRPGFLTGPRGRVAAEWEQRIQRVTKVNPEIIGVKTWETGCGFTLDVNLPPGGATWHMLKNSAEGLAGDARLPHGCGVEVHPGVHRGAALISVATVDGMAEEKTYPADYSPRSINDPIQVGVHRDGSTAEVSLRYACGILVGQTGSGKSNQLQVINAGLARCSDTLIWHLDLSGAGFSNAWTAPHREGLIDRPIIDWVAATLPDAEAMLQAAKDIVSTRKTVYAGLMRSANEDKLPVSHEVPQIVIVVDEFAELPNKIKDALESVSNIGRQSGVRTINCGLRGTSDVFPAGIKKQSRTRMGMRVQDPEELSYLFGWGKTLTPEDATHEGSGFVVTGDGQPRVFRGYRLKPSCIDQVAVATAQYRPVLDDASKVGAWVKTYEARNGKPVPVLATKGAPAMHATSDPGGTLDDAVRRVDTAFAGLKRLNAELDQQQQTDPDLLAQFDQVLKGWDEPLKRDPQQALIHIITKAGPEGISPAELIVNLEQSGFPISRQRLHVWLADALTRGAVTKLRQGKYCSTKREM